MIMTSKRPSGGATDDLPDPKRHCSGDSAEFNAATTDQDSFTNSGSDASRNSSASPSDSIDTPRDTDEELPRQSDTPRYSDDEVWRRSDVEMSMRNNVGDSNRQFVDVFARKSGNGTSGNDDGDVDDSDVDDDDDDGVGDVDDVNKDGYDDDDHDDGSSSSTGDDQSKPPGDDTHRHIDDDSHMSRDDETSRDNNRGTFLSTDDDTRWHNEGVSSRNANDDQFKSKYDSPRSTHVDKPTPTDTLRNNHDTSDCGSETKAVQTEERPPLLIIIREEKTHARDTDAHVDDTEESKCEKIEFKDEPTVEAAWCICKDKQPLDCELPLKMDGMDPLQPLDDRSDFKHQSTDDEIKNEDKYFEESFSLAITKSPVNGRCINCRENENINRDDNENTPPEKCVELQDANVAPYQENRTLESDEHLADDTGRTSHKETLQPPSNPLGEVGKSVSTAKPNAPDTAVLQLLVETQFLQKNRTENQENNIILAGRPTPIMGKSPEYVDPKNFLKGFWATEKVYKEIPWLTGLMNHLKYYCWPCLLFSKNRWFVRGGESTQKFEAAINEHSETFLHRVAFKYLKIRESELKASNTSVENCEVVKTKQALLALLVRILCSKKIKVSNNDADFDGLVEILEVAGTYEPKLHQTSEKLFSEVSLINFVSRHVQNVLPSIQAEISVRIREEISNTPFVSLIYEDTECVVERSSQVAVILRMVTEKGEINERFVKFVSIEQSRNAFDILESHVALIEELGIAGKLVGYTFSGTIIAPDGIQQFIEIANKESPRAAFFYHPDHNLKEIMLQSLSHVEECQRFFVVILDLVKFLTTNSGAIPTLTTFIQQNKPGSPPFGERSFTINIISTMFCYYPLIIKFFQNVSKKFWNDEIATHAPVFTKFLQDPFNRFLIAVVAAILDTVDALCNVVQRGYNSEQWNSESIKALLKLRTLKTNGVDYFLRLASNTRMQCSQDQSIDDGMPAICPDIFNQIIGTAIDCVLYRVGIADTFYLNRANERSVFDLLQSPEVWNRYVRRGSMDYNDDKMDFFTICAITFNGKSIPETLEAVSKMRTSSELEEWSRFVRFCALATSPAKSPPSAPSAVLKLKSYMKDKEKFDSTEAMMFLEKGFLRSLLVNEEFIEDVISHYAKTQHNF